MNLDLTAKFKKARRLLKNGEHTRAIEVYKKLLRRASENCEVHEGIGRAYLANREFKFASAHLSQAINLGARSAKIFAESAEAYNSLNQYSDAETMARAAVALDSDFLPGLRQLLKSLLSQAKYEEALQLGEYLIQKSPDNVGDRMLSGWACVALERYDMAINHGAKAVAINPSEAGGYYLLSRIYKNVQRWDDAMAMAEKACVLAPKNPEYIAMKADMLEHQGHYDEAYELVVPLVEGLNPQRNGLAVHVYASLAKRFGKQDRAVKLLENLAVEGKGFRGMQHATLTLLANIHDARGDYDKAFEAIDAANKVRPSHHDKNSVDEYVNGMMDWFSREQLQASARADHDEVSPIFIVGMPRSGTSLTEKILSRHPEIHAGGEMIHLPFMLHKELPALLGSEEQFPACMDALTPEVAAQAAKKYLDNVCRAEVRGGLRVTDKRPMNYMYLGAIALIFPNAKIINCTRDPLDIGLSCYFANFASSSEMGFSQDLEGIGHYFNRYSHMMSHWHDVLPLPILDLSYEELVSDPEGKIAELLDFCGLPWHEECLSPHESEQVTMTASYEQVRKPINTQSIGRWKNYEKHLAPLREVLGLAQTKAA